ncbi:hypothetical protein [Massilia horti]|uniref:Uncharacterized protein n=1 Tax=Massilia horti TaxID=2562153 RepID=A0A4Y9T2Z0_9BURK|nr:hypothetical protein [Massilia horti]TFW33574.1 hypothetical protein E4O92_06135 [Massilia horti]
MKTTKLFPSLCSPSEALFDQIERDLLALSTAALDDEAPPSGCVDEFSNEFPLPLRRPPN